MQESGFTMIFHSALIMGLLYVVMRFALGQSAVVAEDRSVFLGAIVLAYMLLFGHGAPTLAINPRLRVF